MSRFYISRTTSYTLRISEIIKMPRKSIDEDLIPSKSRKKVTPAKSSRSKSVVVDAEPIRATEKQRKYAEARGLGLKRTDAAAAAGMKPNDGTLNALEKTPNVMELLKAEGRKNAYMLGMTRDKVLQGMLDAVDQAKLLTDPMAQIAGWREIAKICGFYAPEVKKIELSGGAKRVLQRFEQMSDDELLALHEGEIIDVEFKEIDQ